MRTISDKYLAQSHLHRNTCDLPSFLFDEKSQSQEVKMFPNSGLNLVVFLSVVSSAYGKSFFVLFRFVFVLFLVRTENYIMN